MKFRDNYHDPCKHNATRRTERQRFYPFAEQQRFKERDKKEGKVEKCKNSYRHCRDLDGEEESSQWTASIKPAAAGGKIITF